MLFCVLYLDLLSEDAWHSVHPAYILPCFFTLALKTLLEFLKSKTSKVLSGYISNISLAVQYVAPLKVMG